MKLSIIIPVFNEEKTIRQVLHTLSTISLLPQTQKEIIIVNDGSSDATASKIKDQKSKFKNLIVIHHKRNYGKGQAVRTGIKYATGDYILIQDADAEYHPQDIVALLTPIHRREAQVVYGSRLKRMPHFHQEESTFRFFLHYLGNKGLSLLTSLLYGQWITDMETGYKVFPAKAVLSMQLHAKGFEIEPEITAKLLKAGYRIYEVSITTVPRGYTEGKKLQTIRDGLKAFSAIIKYRFSD